MTHFSVRSDQVYSVVEEWLHAVTHGLGFILSLVGLAFLVSAASAYGTGSLVVGVTVFGIAMAVLYLASCLNHAVPHLHWKPALLAFDHCAIFLLIAGTYTPFALMLPGAWSGPLLLGLVWGLAAYGILLRFVNPARFDRISLWIYLAMGWLGCIWAIPICERLGFSASILLGAGGLAYTIGTVFFAWRSLRFNHVVWHMLVLAGSACHYAAVMLGVMGAHA